MPRLRSSRSIALLLAGLCWFATADARAQTNTGQISGIVRDSSGGVLPGATVAALHPASGQSFERVTDAAGRFYLPELRVGQWDITVRLAGFAPQTTRGVVLEIGRTLTLEFALGLEGLAEEVTVTGTAPLLQTTTAEISDVIENK